MKIIKFLLTVIITIFTITGYTQTTEITSQKYSFKKEYGSILATFLAGASDGTGEVLYHHYERFSDRIPNNNPNYWNPQISWKYKYKNNDYTQGEKFPGSTTLFVWSTSGYHMLHFTRNTMVVTAILLHPREKKKLKYYLVDVFAHTAAFHLGFNTSYHVIFK